MGRRRGGKGEDRMLEGSLLEYKMLTLNQRFVVITKRECAERHLFLIALKGSAEKQRLDPVIGGTKDDSRG